MNFDLLPANWVLDYNSLQGREITALAWTSRQWGTFFGGQSFNALGKLHDCDDGKVALLTLIRSRRGDIDTANFHVSIWDVDGKLLDRHLVGTTQKDSSGRPLAVSFAVRTSGMQRLLDIRQARWDGDRTNTLTINKTDCSVQ